MNANLLVVSLVLALGAGALSPAPLRAQEARAQEERVRNGLAQGDQAQEEPAQEPELSELLEVLKEETEIATKTRMNSDFVPGIVTVLDAEKLEALGARTVWDALVYVPGVHATLDGTGAPSVIVRGIPFPFNSGSIQILLNSIPIGRETAGLNGSALYLPIEQVERIEFVRGPGSVLYGDAAFQGLLNVITRKDGQRVDVGADSHSMHGANLLLSSHGAPWQTSLNLAAADSDDAVVPIGAKAREDRFSGILETRRGGFSATGELIQRQVYDADALPANLTRDEYALALEARYDRSLRAGLDLRLRAQYLESDFETPSSDFTGDQFKGGADIFWSGWARQTWLAGIEYLDGSIERASVVVPSPPPPPPGVPPPPPQQVPNRVVRDRTRTVASIYVQDQIELSDRLSATLGARYDDNSDLGSRITPRVALVWRIADRHVLKAQYSEGFRGPTFFEQYLNGPTPLALDFEVNRTAEVNYVYQRPHLTARATVFSTRIDDMVFRDFARNRFANVAHADADGVELEWSQQLHESLRLDANASYVESEHNRNPTLTTTSITTAPHFMTNAGLLFNPRRELIFGLHWNHVDDRAGAAPQSGKYDLVDLTFTRKDLFVDRLDWRLGVQNLFDRRVLQLFPGPTGDIPFAYRDRTVWSRLTWRW